MALSKGMRLASTVAVICAICSVTALIILTPLVIVEISNIRNEIDEDIFEFKGLSDEIWREIVTLSTAQSRHYRQVLNRIGNFPSLSRARYYSPSPPSPPSPPSTGFGPSNSFPNSPGYIAPPAPSYGMHQPVTLPQYLLHERANEVRLAPGNQPPGDFVGFRAGYEPTPSPLPPPIDSFDTYSRHVANTILQQHKPTFPPYTAPPPTDVDLSSEDSYESYADKLAQNLRDPEKLRNYLLSQGGGVFPPAIPPSSLFNQQPSLTTIKPPPLDTGTQASYFNNDQLHSLSQYTDDDLIQVIEEISQVVAPPGLPQIPLDQLPKSRLPQVQNSAPIRKFPEISFSAPDYSIVPEEEEKGVKFPEISFSAPDYSVQPDEEYKPVKLSLDDAAAPPAPAKSPGVSPPGDRPICVCSQRSTNNCPAGPPGPKGRRGAPGVNGLPGPKAKDGLPAKDVLPTRNDWCHTCPAGKPGKPGHPGDIGYPGPAGRFGPNGLPGIPSAKGDPGFLGGRGQTGIPGKPGIRGQEGLISILMVGKPGLKGLPGPQGIMGDRAFMGSPGRAGLMGDVGPEGFAGHLGQNGTDGRRGYRGRSGLLGYEIQHCDCPGRTQWR